MNPIRIVDTSVSSFVYNFYKKKLIIRTKNIDINYIYCCISSDQILMPKCFGCMYVNI